MLNSIKLKNISKTIGSGITPLRSNPRYWENGTVYWLKTEQLGEHLIYETSEKISQDAINETSIKTFPKNTLSIAMYGEGRTRGNVSILKAEMTTNQACCNIVIDNKKADYEYVYYFLKTQYINLRSLSSGVRKNLNSNDIKEFEIRLPNEMQTQKKIAKVLSDLDAKIELNNRINTELEAMAKTLYDYWFVQFDFPDVNGKPYKTSGGKMVWSAELKREIPDGWEVGNIMTLANLLGGGTPKTNNPNYWSGDIPFFTPADAEDSIYSTNTKQKITEIGLKNSSTKRYSKGTIFITARGTVGKINIASQDMAMNQSCYALQGKENVNSQFLYFYTNELVHYIKSKASGSIFKALVTNDFKFTKMIVPPLSLLQNFDVFSKSIFATVLNNKLENQELASLRDWLLPMLMNGQVSVGDASALRQAQEDELNMVAEERGSYGK